MKLALLLVTLCSTAFCMPRDNHIHGVGKCGKETVKQFKFTRTENAEMGYACELCLDMVLLAEQYAECGEAEIENVLDHKCDKDFSSLFIEKLCRSMINKIAHEFIDETEKDPAKICHKIIHKQCSYGFV